MQTLKNTIMLVVAASAALSSGFGADGNSPKQALARIGNESVYEDDLLPSIGAQLLQLKTQEYELKNRALESVLNNRVLEAEAMTKGLSPEALLTQTVDDKVEPPTPNEVQAYFLAQKAQTSRAFADVKQQIEASLREAKRQQARQDYIDGLRKTAGVAVLLTRPRMEVSPDLARIRGKADASVTIVEFSDFECPYCAAAQASVKEVLARFPNEVRLSYRDFPLRQIHPSAQQAAEAARCAGEQQKFWEYHDRLFGNQGKLDHAGLTESARAEGLDTDKFSACLTSGKFKAQIDSDFQAGIRYGINGTPAFFINGILITGNQPFSEFERIIATELEAARAPKAAIASRE